VPNNGLPSRLEVVARALRLDGKPVGKRVRSRLFFEVCERLESLTPPPSRKAIEHYFNGKNEPKRFREDLRKAVIEIGSKQKTAIPQDWMDLPESELAHHLGVNVPELRNSNLSVPISRKSRHPAYTYDITVTDQQIGRFNQKYKGVWSLFRLHSRRVNHSVYREILIIGDGQNSHTPSASALTAPDVELHGHVLVTDQALNIQMVTRPDQERVITESIHIMRAVQSDWITYGLRTRFSENLSRLVTYRTILLRQPELDSFHGTEISKDLAGRVTNYPEGTYLHGKIAHLLGEHALDRETEAGVLHFEGTDLPDLLADMDRNEENWSSVISRRIN